MPKHIGIVGISYRGAALCYETICARACEVMGAHAFPEISMHSFGLQRYMEHIDQDNWPAVASLLQQSADRLRAAGADFWICAANAPHAAFKYLADDVKYSSIHIARAVSARALAAGCKKLGILGTRYLMEGNVYSETLAECGLNHETPDSADRHKINQIIFDEMMQGVCSDSSREYFKQISLELAQRGCDGVLLACTEIPVVLGAEFFPLPAFDSTRILAEEALHFALKVE